jgi:chromosome segregation ATPase
MRYTQLLDNPDAVERWKQDAERLEEERAAARRQREQEERQIMTTSEIAPLEARITELENANQGLRTELAGVMRAIAESFDTLASEPAQARTEIHRLDIEMTKLGTQVAELREQRAKECADLAGVMSAIAASFNTLSSERADLAAQTRTELHRLGTEMAKLGSEVAELREQRAKAFQFARERSDVEDLPNPLPSRRTH